MLETHTEAPYHYKRFRKNGKMKTFGRQGQVFDPPAPERSRDRLIHEALQKLQGMTIAEICKGSERYNPTKQPISYACVRNWYKPAKHGGTLYPQTRTLNAVLQAHGYHLKIAKMPT